MSPQRVWVAPGVPTVVAGQTIPGGMLYVGQYLRSGVGTIEPSLINPVLPVDLHDAARPARDLAPRPSYHLISAADRAAYLAWLAGGRRSDVPIGFVRLFFSGLERRVLLDRADDPAVAAELPAIAAEVRRLRAAHDSRSFASADAFLDVLDLLEATGFTSGGRPFDPPAGPAVFGVPGLLNQERGPVPLTLRVTLAQFAASGVPVRADWARCWAWYHPSLLPGTPQTRCPAEFDTLFALRYRARFPAGLLPRTAERPPLRIGYRPQSPGLDPITVERPDLPDVLEESTATRALGALVDSVTQALTPYSRWLARTPGGEGSTASSSLLPSELLEHDPGPLRPLLTWAGARLEGRSSAVIDGGDFASFWSTADPARMSRDESGALSAVLARIGFGVEPDVHFGGPPLATGPAVLFRLDQSAPDRSSPGYPGAAIMLEIAAATIRATASMRPDDINQTVTALAAHVQLTIGERTRLSARLRWLLAGGPSTGRAEATRIRRRSATLTETERAAAGLFLLDVAATAAVGNVDGEMVSRLTEAYRLIGLPEELLFRRLHRQSLAEDDAPVVVRRARAEPAGYPLPRSSRTTPTPPASPGSPGSLVQLRASVVNRTISQTEAVSALLGDIFLDEEPDPRIEAKAGQLSGLDHAHDGLLRELTTRSSWARSELAELAERHGVLPDGALDLINEVALELTGEPVIEGDDELRINDEVLREILA